MTWAGWIQIAASKSVREVVTTKELTTIRFTELGASAKIVKRDAWSDQGYIGDPARVGKIAAAAFDLLVNGCKLRRRFSPCCLSRILTSSYPPPRSMMAIPRRLTLSCRGMATTTVACRLLVCD